MGVCEKNGFTFIALILIGWYVVELAIAIINTAALYKARWQDERKVLEDMATWHRLNKSGEWNVNEGWKP